MTYKKCPFCGGGVHACVAKYGGWFITHLSPKPDRPMCDAIELPAFKTEQDAEKEWNLQFQFIETYLEKPNKLQVWCRHISRGISGDWMYNGETLAKWNFCPKCGARRPRQ